jgi:hypothetical protein
MSTVRRNQADAQQPRPVDVERSCDTAWLHLVEAGLVGTHPDDLVTATLRTILREAREREAQLRPARRRWAA